VPTGARSHPYRSRLRADSTFFLELQYCYENGIPHSRLLRWSAEDRAKMLAFAVEKGQRCALCGTAQWEWEENRRAYEPVAHQCPGCYALEVAGEGEREPGVTMRLLPTDTREHAQRMQALQRAQRRKRRS
jgi:hypothetical protein